MHELPFWFLLLSLFLPRLSLFICWWGNWLFPIMQPVSGALWLLLPRFLVIFMIFSASGYNSVWLWVHILVAAAVYLFGGGSVTNRRAGS